MCNMFRKVRADEIECRVGTISEKGCSLLLYKDARVDMNILDETVGAMNWQKRYSRDNANCEVGIWDEKKNQWIWKEDTGTESQTEKEKGLASDSFKRACFAWGIGRELYTAPFIWIKVGDVSITTGKNGKPTTFDKFTVSDLGYDEAGRISRLTITKKGAVVFQFGKVGKDIEDRISPEDLAILKVLLEEEDISAGYIMKTYGKKRLEDLSRLEFEQVVKYKKQAKEGSDKWRAKAG